MFKAIERGFRNNIRILLMPFTLRALRGAATSLTTVESIVDFAFTFQHGGVRFTPFQVREEITQFLKLLSQHPPVTILEVGTEKGGTFFLLARVAAPNALLLSLDLPAGDGNSYPPWREPLYRGFAREEQHIELVRKDSHDPRTVERVKDLLAGRPLDLLFIDGDHSYDGVKKDYEMYSPLVARGGAIAFHDIVDGEEANVGGVPRLWRELKQTRQHLEFVKSWQQGGWGIGVLPDFGV
jgi:cephalosporin hydroxylase